MPGLSLGAVGWTFRLADHVSCVAVRPAGDVLAAASLGGDSLVVDIATGGLVTKLPDHPLGALATAWSTDGHRVATGGQDGHIRVCDPTGVPVADLDVGGWVAHLAWSDRHVLAAAAGRTLVLVDHDGRLVHRYPAVSSTITAIRWSDNSTRIGVASYGGVTWFDTDRLPDDTPGREHRFDGSPLGLALSPNGRWACAGYQDASIHVWPLWSGDDLAMSGYPAKIEHLAFRDDSHWLASACLEELTLWDFSGRGPKGTQPATGAAHSGRVTWLGWQPAGTLLATGDHDGTIALWPSPHSVSRPLEPLAVVDGEHAVGAGAWLADGSGVVIGRGDGSLELRPVG